MESRVDFPDTSASSLSGPSGDFRGGLRWSIFLHVAIFGWIAVRSLVFPGEPMRIIPTLRVDLVGLPDVLKKDLKAPSNGPSSPNEKSAKANSKEKPDDDADAMHLKKTEVKNEKKLKDALDRMKALAKINAESDDKSETAPLLKGNKISKGTAISGDAKESAELNYYDLVRNRLQDRWALPVYLARRNLSARVQISIDARGRVDSFRFVQPSGNAQFDDNVRKTIQSSQPFPAPPRELLGVMGTHGILVGFPL